jgi:hypothetical protein
MEIEIDEERNFWEQKVNAFQEQLQNLHILLDQERYTSAAIP